MDEIANGFSYSIYFSFTWSGVVVIRLRSSRLMRVCQSSRANKYPLISAKDVPRALHSTSAISAQYLKRVKSSVMNYVIDWDEM
jgi:hypothetical protein